jgi:hypothetical protein
MAVRLSALRAGRLLPPEKFLVLISIIDWVNPRAIVRLEELGLYKNLMASPGIEPATFQLVAVFQVRYSMPLYINILFVAEK